MGKFPIFLELAGRQVLIFGGGAVACRRAASLMPFGPELQVIAPVVTPELEALGVPISRRNYVPGEMSRPFLVLAATDNPAVNAAITAEARAKGALANNASNHEDCDFYFPALAMTPELTVGITGTGANHSRVKTAAEEIRALLSGRPRK